jgi:hypothetical protein
MHVLTRAELKERLPWLTSMARLGRRVPGASLLRAAYADVHTERVFTNVYRENMWGDADSASGAGSNLRATAVIRDVLPTWVEELGVRVLLDVPCGDFHWFSRMNLPIDSYVGGDIVRELVERNQQRHGSPSRRFLHLDASRDPLPRADLVLCRDLFIHLSFAKVRRVLENVAASGATWLAASTYADCERNQPAITGGCRPVNLQIEPLGLPAPLRIICEEESPRPGNPSNKYLGLWRVGDLGAALMAAAS